MKKTLLILTLVSALALAGCSSNSSSSEATSSTLPESSSASQESTTESSTLPEVEEDMELSSVYTILAQDSAPEDAVAVIGNIFVGSEKAPSFTLEATKTLELNTSGGAIYIVPKNVGTKIVVSTVDQASTDFAPKEAIYINEASEDGFVLKLNSDRPEGMPSYVVEFTQGENTVKYYISYNGKDGHKEIEYITPQAPQV